MFHNGDRVCLLHSRSGLLEFGRILEYIEEPAKPPNDDDAVFLDLPGSGSPKQSMVKIPLASLLTSPPRTPCPVIPGITSPMQRSHQSILARGSIDPSSEIKRQVIWDDNKGETDVKAEIGNTIFRVVDRRFTVGQRVLNCDGLRGLVVESTPLATIKVTDGIAQSNRCIIPNVDLSNIHPMSVMSPLFAGVTVEYNGWIGQVCQVQRSAVYKLQDSSTLTRTFFDPTRQSMVSAAQAAAIKKKERSIMNAFSYPYMPHISGVPFEGKMIRLSRAQVEQTRQDDEDDKENCEGFCSRSFGESTTTAPTPSPTTSSSSSSATASASPDYVQNSPAMLSLYARRKARAEREDCVTALVLSVSIVGIKVRWTGRLPEYLIKSSSGEEKEKATTHPTTSTMPQSIIRGDEDIKLVRSLYINPSMYFDKKGLCVYYKPTRITSSSSETSNSGDSTSTTSRNELLTEKEWAAKLFRSLESNNDNCEETDADAAAPFNLGDITVTGASTPTGRKDLFTSRGDNNNSGRSIITSGKRKRIYQQDDEESGVSRKVVCKHFVRHKYKVIWEPREGGRKCFTPHGETTENYGNELEPDLSQEHKLCLGLIHSHLYVVAKKGSWMEGKWDYGVVIEKPTDDSVVVEWLKIQADGSVQTDRILNCSLVEIDKHPRFNELHEGRIVVRGPNAANYKLCGEFLFGTVVSVHRFALGQISVYCPIQLKVVMLWPHMLEVFEGLSMQEQIALKVVGLKKDTNWDTNNPNNHN